MRIEQISTEIRETGYVIIDPTGDILPSTFQYLRKDCIAEMLRGSKSTWRFCLRRGWKCVKAKKTIKTIG